MSGGFGWLLFGLGPQPAVPAGYPLYYSLASAYEPPEILRKIATGRSQPYTYYERKRTHNRWRYYDDVHARSTQQLTSVRSMR